MCTRRAYLDAKSKQARMADNTQVKSITFGTIAHEIFQEAISNPKGPDFSEETLLQAIKEKVKKNLVEIYVADQTSATAGLFLVLHPQASPFTFCQPVVSIPLPAFGTFCDLTGFL